MNEWDEEDFPVEYFSLPNAEVDKGTVFAYSSNDFTSCIFKKEQNVVCIVIKKYALPAD